MKFKPEDIVILILSAVVVISLGVYAINSALRSLPISTDKIDIINTIYVSVLSIIALYIGSKLNNKKDE